MAGTALRTRRPTGQASWPLVLLSGDAKTGKTFTAARFTGDPRVGRAFWLDLGEGCADEYGSVPGADYEIIEHNGTWIEIVESAQAVKEIAKQELAAGNPPAVFVIDSMTAEWAMLTEWVNNRAKSSKRNKALLAQDPDAEIDISANYWNDANSRHNRLMNILKTFPGIVIMTTLETEKTQIGPGGRPIENAPKVAKPDAQKRLPADATVWIRLSLTEPPVLVGVRSVKVNIRPGQDKPKPIPDFSLGELIFDKMGLKAGAAVREVPLLDANQVAPGEEVEEPQEQRAARPANRQQRPAQPTWEEKIAKCGKDLQALKDLYPLAPDDIKVKIVARVKEIDPQALARKASAKPVESQPDVVDAEIVEDSPKTPSVQDTVDQLIVCDNFDIAETIRKAGTSTNVADFLDDEVREALNLPSDRAIPLNLLATKIGSYVRKHGYSVQHGLDLVDGADAA